MLSTNNLCEFRKIFPTTIRTCIRKLAACYMRCECKISTNICMYNTTEPQLQLHRDHPRQNTNTHTKQRGLMYEQHAYAIYMPSHIINNWIVMFMNMLFSIHLLFVFYKQVNMLMCNVNTRFWTRLQFYPFSCSFRGFDHVFFISLSQSSPPPSLAHKMCKSDIRTFPFFSQMKFVIFLEEMECVKEHKTLF